TRPATAVSSGPPPVPRPPPAAQPEPSAPSGPSAEASARAAMLAQSSLAPGAPPPGDAQDMPSMRPIETPPEGWFADPRPAHLRPQPEVPPGAVVDGSVPPPSAKTLYGSPSPDDPVKATPPVDTEPDLPVEEPVEARVSDAGPQGEVQEGFFRASEDLGKVEHETWDDLQKVEAAVSSGGRGAMWATAGIALGGLILLGAFLGYQWAFVPSEAPLAGSSASPSLPEADALNLGDEGEAPAEEAEMETDVSAAAPAADAEEAEAVAEVEEVAATGDEAPESSAEETAEAPTEVAEAEAAAPPPGEPGDLQQLPTENVTRSYSELLAAAARARGRQAIEAYQAAIALNPNGAEALSGLAFELVKPGRQVGEAERYAQLAVQHDPNDIRGWFSLGAARHLAENDDGAREAYETCVDRGGDNSFVRECRSNLRTLR
ncbi:MAG: hypothetical protein ACFCGT_24580, partial [Sandaracinaceae bacterium]